MNTHQWIQIGIYIFLCFIYAPVFAQEPLETQSAEDLTSTSFNIGIKKSYPFSFKNTEGQWDGPSVKLWEHIATELEIDFVYQEKNDLSEMLDGVSTSEFDIIIGAITATKQREVIFDFSHPYYLTGLSMAVRTNKGFTHNLQRIFNLEFIFALMILILAIFSAALLFWLAERKHDPFQGLSGLGEAFWWSAVTMTTVGYGDKVPATRTGKMVAMLWMFSSLLLLTTIFASIVSAFAVDRLQNNISGTSDLPRLSIGTITASSSTEFLKENNLSFKNYDSVEEGFDALITNEIDTFIYDRPLIQYALQSNQEKKQKIHLLPEVFSTQHYAMGMPTGSALREPINQEIIDYIQHDNWHNYLDSIFGEN